jgi:chromate transporter
MKRLGFSRAGQSSGAGGDNGRMSPLPAEERPQPKSLTDLFISFTLLALQGFGGVLAIVQRELVEKKQWMTREEFIEDWAVAQIMPGPNVVNLSLMVGGRYFGLKGAMAALAGMLTLPLVLVLILAVLYAQFAGHPGVAGALARHGRGGGRVDRRDRPQAFWGAPEERAGHAAVHRAGRAVFCGDRAAAHSAGLCVANLGLTACVLAYRRLKP